jgi:hypothetical protein
VTPARLAELSSAITAGELPTNTWLETADAR